MSEDIGSGPVHPAAGDPSALGTNPKPESDPGIPAASPTTFQIPVGRLEERDPNSLDEHSLLRRLFIDLGTAEANEDLLDSMAGRQYRPVLVTGVNCDGTLPDTVLDGRRLRRVAHKLGLPLTVEVLDDLTAEMQAKVIIHSNIASGLSRRYDERAKAALHHYCIQTYGKRQGQRTDLTSVQTHGSDRKETAQVVADLMRKEYGDNEVTPTSVREGQLIFYDPVSTETLKRAVTEGTVARRPAADMVRRVRKEPEVAAVLTELRASEATVDLISAHHVIVAAKARIIAEVESLLGKKAKKSPPSTPPRKTEASAAVVHGFASIPNFLGRKVVVQLVDGKVVLKDMGAADADPNIYVPDATTTRASWPVDVAAVVDELPGDVRAGVAVSEVENLEPVKCDVCGGTRFYEGCGCVTCVPPLWLPDRRNIDAEAEREVAEIVGATEWDIYKHHPEYSKYTLERPLTGEEWASNRIMLKVGLLVEERKRAAHRVARDEARRRDPLGLGLRGLVQDLRAPRTRVRISTPGGDMSIILWARERDWMPSFRTHPDTPCVVIPTMAVPIYLRDEPWNCRAHLRERVRAALMGMLRPPAKAGRDDSPVPSPDVEPEVARVLPVILGGPYA